MNGYPDNRELRARCTLSVMNAGQNGSFFSGDYSAASSVRAAENTEVANSSFNSVYNVKGVNYKKFSIHSPMERYQKLIQLQVLHRQHLHLVA
jgi:hypothetical protein